MKNSKEKLALLVAFVYIATMGVGMFTMYHVFGIEYKDPNMVRVIIFVEIILTAIALFANLKFFDNSGFDKLKKSGLKWFAPFGILMAVTVILFFATANWGNFDGFLVLLIFVTCTLVGISEEVMFRGIVLNTFLKSGNVMRAILISSITFSLLHAVNVFAAVTVPQMLVQLVMTFIAGILFACIAVKTDNIVPLIIYHALWDSTLIASNVTGSVVGIMTTVALLLEIVFAIVYFIKIKKGEKK